MNNTVFSQQDNKIIMKFNDTKYDIFVDLGKFLLKSGTLNDITQESVLKFLECHKKELKVFNSYVCSELGKVADLTGYSTLDMDKLLEDYKSKLVDLNLLSSQYKFGFSDYSSSDKSSFPLGGTVDNKVTTDLETVLFLTFCRNIISLMTRNGWKGCNGRVFYYIESRMKFIRESLDLPRENN